MIANTLRKWRQNWQFLLAVSVTVILLSQLSTHAVTDRVPWCFEAPCPAPEPIWPRVLCWPFLGRIEVGALNGESVRGLFPEKEGWLLTALCFWNAFLWAWALLELRQVLARTLARPPRAGE